MYCLEVEMRKMHELCQFVEMNRFGVVMVEGPRGSGKTTLCQWLFEKSDVGFYKTWGGSQRYIKENIQRDFGLELPQGTYFALDFVRQVKLSHAVIADRGNLSALVYQRTLNYGSNPELDKYYVTLMEESRSVLLVISGPPEVIWDRRISRKDDDEFKLHKTKPTEAMAAVARDCEMYEEATSRMVDAGLIEVCSFELAEGFSCSAYVPANLEVKLPTEGFCESDEG